MTELCAFEVKALRAVRDGTLDRILPGAALNQAMESLREAGFVTPGGEITNKGRFHLATRDERR